MTLWHAVTPDNNIDYALCVRNEACIYLSVFKTDNQWMFTYYDFTNDFRVVYDGTLEWCVKAAYRVMCA